MVTVTIPYDVFVPHFATGSGAAALECLRAIDRSMQMKLSESRTKEQIWESRVLDAARKVKQTAQEHYDTARNTRGNNPDRYATEERALEAQDKLIDVARDGISRKG